MILRTSSQSLPITRTLIAVCYYIFFYERLRSGPGARNAGLRNRQQPVGWWAQCSQRLGWLDLKHQECGSHPHRSQSSWTGTRWHLREGMGKCTLVCFRLFLPSPILFSLHQGNWGNIWDCLIISEQTCPEHVDDKKRKGKKNKLECLDQSCVCILISSEY